MDEEGNRTVLVGGRLRSHFRWTFHFCSGVVRRARLGSKNIGWQPRFDEKYYTVMYISMADIWETIMRGKFKKAASPSSVGVDFL